MTILPERYQPALGLYETQKAIGLIKNIFQVKLCAALHLKRVTAPLFVDPATGLNDDLNGVERPVSFDIPAVGKEAQVVHSLAKWKRLALHDYNFFVGNGLVADMNAIRRDEELDNSPTWARNCAGTFSSSRPKSWKTSSRCFPPKSGKPPLSKSVKLCLSSRSAER